MSTIPDDILTVAGVVTGDDRTNLTGWQRNHAIAAMTALGYSGRHIAWALNASRDAIYQTAAHDGLHLHRKDQRPDWTAINMVATGAAHIHLTGNDRDQAVRLMADHHTSTEIALRLRTGADEITRIARRLDITLRQPDPWNWYAYVRGYDRQYRRTVAA